jgi:BlaI family penicillinase repressor
MAERKDTNLSEVQLAVMRALWDEGTATTATVHELMGKPRSLAYTTVATLLSRLEKRGLVCSRKEARERVFEPLVSEADVRRHMVSDLVSKLFRGDPRALVSHLVTDAEFDESDLKTVRRMLSEQQQNETKNTKARNGSEGASND